MLGQKIFGWAKKLFGWAKKLFGWVAGKRFERMFEPNVVGKHDTLAIRFMVSRRGVSGGVEEVERARRGGLPGET
jgi:hypothetical protein